MNLEAILQDWITPAVIDVILLGVLAEWLMLRRSLAAGPARDWRKPLAFYLGSGAMLLLAVRFALAGPDRRFVALALSASFVLHVASLGAMWKRIDAATPAPGSKDRG